MLIDQIKKIQSKFFRLYYKLLTKISLSSVGTNSYIISPLRINGGCNISLGSNVIIKNQVWLAAMNLTGNRAKLFIDDNCVLGDYNHIYATQSIVIEKSVLTANHVYISDNSHCYADISIPILKQPIKQLKCVVIGEGSWLGENVSVIGACIGTHSVIGANSVVTHDIPDYCIAVGAPARVIKRYNLTTKVWEKV